jgi:GntR family transcriptional regulator, rspAB operon transcriptional repressor
MEDDVTAPQTADQLAYVIQLRTNLDERPQHGGGDRRPLSDVISSSLREGILDGHIPAGTWLNEELLARALGVSRTPIREALRKLDGEMLTARGPGNSRMVAAPSAEDVVALYRVRESLEGLAANIVASRPNPQLVRELRAITDEMMSIVDTGDGQQLTRLNRQFHSCLWAASRNEHLNRFLVEVRSAITRFGRSPFEVPEIARRYVQDKIDLTNAIERNSPEDAERLAREHMAMAQRQRLAMLYAPGHPLQ